MPDLINEDLAAGSTVEDQRWEKLKLSTEESHSERQKGDGIFASLCQATLPLSREPAEVGERTLSLPGRRD